MTQSELFFRISPDRVLQAVEALGFETTGHCMALNALENRVYDAEKFQWAHPGGSLFVAMFAGTFLADDDTYRFLPQGMHIEFQIL